MSEEYEYIVIGAGSAGSVVASHLSTDPKVRVLLLEAGPPDGHLSLEMPAAFTYASGARVFDWGYRTEPETYLHHRRLGVPRGKVVGGSSSVNAMSFVRGNAADFDRWAAKPGLEMWAYRECLPVFKAMESYSAGADCYRGADGPIGVTAPSYSNPLCEVFLQAAGQAGYDRDVDTNGATQSGFGVWDQSIANGRRMSASRAYLRPVSSRSNLSLRTRAMVTRVLTRNQRAVGVEYIRDGNRERAYAAMEVVSSAGSINSPKLLMLSGIGDAAHLRQFGIHVVHHSPGVGLNLQDHVDVKVRCEARQPISATPYLALHRKLGLALRWVLTGRGLGATNHFEALGYVPVLEDSSLPDVQLGLIPLLVGDDGLALSSGHGFQLTVMGLRPQSRGRVRLTSADPFAAPSIRFNYLAAARDVEVIREGIKCARHIFSQPAFDAVRGEELTPGPFVQSDDQLGQFIRRTGNSNKHPSCTCQMGIDADAVVDGVGRVHGVSGLRVVDASIMPDITSGNINAPTMMIAQTIATQMIQSGR